MVTRVEISSPRPSVLCPNLKPLHCRIHIQIFLHWHHHHHHHHCHCYILLLSPSLVFIVVFITIIILTIVNTIVIIGLQFGVFMYEFYLIWCICFRLGKNQLLYCTTFEWNKYHNHPFYTTFSGFTTCDTVPHPHLGFRHWFGGGRCCCDVIMWFCSCCRQFSNCLQYLQASH